MISQGIALTVAMLVASQALAAVDDPAAARLDFMINCQGCHTADGAGAPGAVPDIRKSLGALLAVPGGREFVQRVPGAATAVLDDARLARVLEWMVRELSDPPPGFKGFDPKETGRLRKSPLLEVKEVRAKLAAQAGISPSY